MDNYLNDKTNELSNSNLSDGEKTSQVCDKCGQNLYLSYIYDALYCPNCNEWKEEACDNPNCEYCAGRPLKPMNTSI